MLSPFLGASAVPLWSLMQFLMRARVFPIENEVCAVATSLQLFYKVELQTVMKAGSWLSGGTFTSF